jgi:chitodextrinase
VINTLEIRSYTPLSETFDTEAPSIPTGLVATDVTEESFQLNWNPSTDNTAVGSYEVFLGSTLVATVSDTFAIISSLQPATTYSVSVRAVDTKDNRSGFSNTLQVTTLGATTEATDYYPAPTGDLTLLTNWGTEVGGGGTNPPSFTTSRQHFNLDRNAIISTAWTISGTDSRLIVLTGSELTINNDITGTIDVEGTGIVNVNSLNSPSFGTLAPTSTVTFSGNPNNIPGANYGNLVLDGNNSTKVFGSGSYTINGDLDVADGISLAGSAGNNTIINILGDLTLAGDANVPSDDQLLTINFVSGGTQSMSATQTDMRFNHIHVTAQTQLNIVAGTTPKTLTVGSSTGGGIVLDSAAVLNLGKNRLVVEAAGAVNPLNQQGMIASEKGDIIVNSTGTQISNLYFKTGADSVNIIRLNANPAGQVNIRSRMYVDNLVDLANGRLNANDQLVLVSDAIHTARIGKVGATATMVGRVEFQRYLDPKGRAYRYLSTPVYSTTVANWDRHLPVTGPFTGSSNGNTTNSLFYYDSDNGGWVGYPSATSQEVMDLGRGYSIFVFEGANAKRLRLLGPIQQGSFAFQNLAADFTPETNETDVEPGNGWTLLGNPYASPIRWGAQGWASTGLDGTVYVRSNQIVNGEVVSEVYEWNGTIGDLPKGIIAQGQSFWVKAVDETTPTLTINEDAKYDTLRATMQREASPRNLLQLTLTKGSFKDRTYVHFTSAGTDAFDQAYDAYKLPNSFFNISSKSGSKNLAINTLPESYCEKVVPLTLQNAKAGQYTFGFAKIESFDYDVEVKLIDRFTGEESTVSEGSQYTFEVTSDPLSFGANRFELQFKKPAIDQSVSLENSTTEFCGDGTAMITLQNSQRGVRYEIMNGGLITKTVTGTGSNLGIGIESSQLHEGVNAFSMKASFEGCTSSELTSTTTINYVKKPIVTIVDNTVVSNYTGTTQWLLDGEPIQGATDAEFEPEVSGEYSVLAIGSNCEVASDPVLFAITGTEDFASNDFIIYPNPVKTKFLVKVPQAKDGTGMVVQIFNTLGMVVGEYQVTNRKEGIEINAENLRAGLYTLRVATQRKQYEKRFIRE